MIRGVYSVRGGLLDSGLFVSSVPALFDRIRSDTEPTYRFFDTVSYTVTGGVHGQECSRSIVRSEESLVERIASRLRIDPRDLDALIDRSSDASYSPIVHDVSIRIVRNREPHPDDVFAIRESGWGYVDTGLLLVPAPHVDSYVAK